MYIHNSQIGLHEDSTSKGYTLSNLPYTFEIVNHNKQLVQGNDFDTPIDKFNELKYINPKVFTMLNDN